MAISCKRKDSVCCMKSDEANTMQPIIGTPGLYGITHSNRNFSDPYYWGKNQFNSSFPVALACYMRDRKIPAVYISHTTDLKTKISQISFDEVFGTALPNSALKFNFEKSFQPFASFVSDEVETIDLVICDAVSGVPIRPLEIKLTTLPDDGTSSFDETRYGSEIVVRSPTLRYMALSMGQACVESKEEIKKIFTPVCQKIRDWTNAREMCTHRDAIFAALELFLSKYSHHQKPLLMQPVWKTIGKSPTLADNCLDVFVWSDFALARLFMDAIEGLDLSDIRITRLQRAALRLARFIYEFSLSGSVFQEPIFDGMTYDTLNDKEFAVPGRKTNFYMACDRLTKPIVAKNEIRNIILGGGQKFLSPERRFDSILYFSEDLFNE